MPNEILQETLLVWLEELAQRLESGVYVAGRVIPDLDGSEGVNLFPARGPEVCVRVCGCPWVLGFVRHG
jgi:hypothetical protein